MYLVDTNVISDLRRPATANPKVVAWIDSVARSSLFVSAITVHELEVGTQRKEKRDPAQGAVFRKWLDQEVLPSFGDRILGVDCEIAQLAAGFQVPDPAPLQDMLIAATALVHNMTFVTRNVQDFQRTGVRLLNPWDLHAV